MRLLVVTGATVADVAEIPESIRAFIERASDVFVVTPLLPRRLQWLVSDIDSAKTVADERLDTVLGHVQSMVADAAGRVGADEPMLAFGDAIRDFQPDHILIGLGPADHAGWQRRGLLDAVVSGFHLPTTVFEIASADRSA